MFKEYGYAEAMCLRSFVSGVSFPKSVSPEQSLNKKAPLFVHGICLRRSLVPQKPCERGAISKVGAPKQSLNKIEPLFVQGIRLRRSLVPQKPCGGGVILKTGILEQNTGTLCSRISLTGRADACDGKADTHGTHSGLPCLRKHPRHKWYEPAHHLPP